MRRSTIADTKRKARVLIVDDHPVVRKGLRNLLDSEAGLAVCGEADDMTEALRLVESEKPDLVLIDISLKSGSGIELIKQIKARNAKTKMLVSSMHDELLYAQRCLSAGAMGYIMKMEDAEEMIQAVHCVLGGKVYLSGRMTDRLLNSIAGRGKDPTHSPVSVLTDRELEVFEMIGEGMTTSQTAERLHLSTKTVDAHRENIKRKLSLASGNELVRRAMQWVMDERRDG
jgi:DNA-binding NarL/FixJ family response regulator